VVDVVDDFVVNGHDVGHVLVDDMLVDDVVDGQVLGIVVEVIVIVDNDSLMSVNVLDNSEWVELDLVGDLVLAADKDTVVEDLDEVLHVLLNLDLIPVNTDASVGDGESLLLVGSLDLDLHDSLLEESAVEVEVSCTVLQSVGLVSGVGVVLVVVQVESGVDGILMDGQAIWLDVVRESKVVARAVVIMSLTLLRSWVSNELISITGQKASESFTVVLLAAGLVELLMEGLITSLAVRDGGGVIGILVVSEGVVLVVTWVVNVVTLSHVVLGVDGVLVGIVASGVMVAVVLLLSLASVLLWLAEDGLEGHAVGGELVAGGLDLEGKDASS
jgi:hypothetical protein